MNELIETIGVFTAGGLGAGLGLTVLRGLWSAVTYREQTLWANTKVEIERAKNQHALPPQNFAPSYQIEVSPHNTNTVHGAPDLQPNEGQLPKAGESVFDAIDTAFHTLIVGPTGTGKTLLINEMVENRWAKEGPVVVIDPDNHDEKWDSACKLLQGPIESYDEEFERIITPAIDERHAWYEKHGGAIPKRKLHLIIDEAHDVLTECSVIFERVTRLVKRGRKLGISVTLVTTDSQAESLKLKGKTKLLTNMARVELKIDNGKRYCTLEGSLWELPQIHRDIPSVADDDQPNDSMPDASDQPEKPAAIVKSLDVTDDEIKAWLVEGLSKNQICKRFRGAKAKQLERIAQIETAMKTAA